MKKDYLTGVNHYLHINYNPNNSGTVTGICHGSNEFVRIMSFKNAGVTIIVKPFFTINCINITVLNLLTPQVTPW